MVGTRWKTGMRRGTLKEVLTENERTFMNVVTAGSMGNVTAEKVSTLDTIKVRIVIVRGEKIGGANLVVGSERGRDGDQGVVTAVTESVRTALQTDMACLVTSARVVVRRTGTGDLHQAPTGRGHVVVIVTVVSPAVAAVAAVGEVATRRSRTS